MSAAVRLLVAVDGSVPEPLQRKQVPPNFLPLPAQRIHSFAGMTRLFLVFCTAVLINSMEGAF